MPLHTVSVVLVTVMVGVIIGFTTMIILLLLVVVTVQGLAELATQRMLSPFAGVYVYVMVVAPVTGLPFTRHWYVNHVAPPDAAEVNVTDVPLHTVSVVLVIVSVGVIIGFTTMMILLLLVVETVQGAAEDAIQRMLSPFAGI